MDEDTTTEAQTSSTSEDPKRGKDSALPLKSRRSRPASSQLSRDTPITTVPSSNDVPKSTNGTGRSTTTTTTIITTTTTTPAPKQQQQKQHETPAAMDIQAEEQEYDDFGLPIRKFTAPASTAARSGTATPSEPGSAVEEKSGVTKRKWSLSLRKRSTSRSGSVGDNQRPSAAESRSSSLASGTKPRKSGPDSDSDDDFKDASSKPASETASVKDADVPKDAEPRTPVPAKPAPEATSNGGQAAAEKGKPTIRQVEKSSTDSPAVELAEQGNQDMEQAKPAGAEVKEAPESEKGKEKAPVLGHRREVSTASAADAAQVSEFSHQQIAAKKEEKTDDDGGWQTMPSFAPYDIYDDDNKLVAKEFNEEEDETQKYGYGGLGGAGKGYTRVVVDDDAESATSMDENTNYLFNKVQGTSLTEEQEEEEQRDTVSQLQATKDLLTEGQRIAYVGLTRLEISAMNKEFESMEQTRRTKKEIQLAAEALQMWGQKMMIRLYAHMEINAAEQIMIEQLSDHGVVPADVTPVLMANARVKNPMAEEEGEGDEKESTAGDPTSVSLSTPPASAALSPPPMSSEKGESRSSSRSASQRPSGEDRRDLENDTEKDTEKDKKKEKEKESGEGYFAGDLGDDDEEAVPPPPPYEAHPKGDMPMVRTPTQLPTTEKIDIDLRWTVLCDLFLVLIADSIYDARSRCLLERVGKSLEISWLDICKFEKKVTDALEMQQNSEKENWNEDEHMESRRKQALKRRYVMMGLATVGGGLVIGLSAGLLAPLIGGGLAAGFTTIGIAGTQSFLGGAAAGAIITSGAAASGSVIGVRAADRRTGAVKTFEYRPLHNNKRVNLIVTISGWMTGKVDDVRLPFSTVDSIMGDIYSVLWEPEMLTSMGDTINILATEALTQGLQQVLGSTILVSLMAALQLPVVLTKLAYLIDNPWAVSLDRATAAGLILADSLIDRNLGTRPITLVGYSLGSRVIFSCLQELARKGAVGLIQNVYIFGSPVVVKKDEYLRVRTVVSGRFVNGYNRNDWILGYLFRLTNGGIRRVAGLGPVEGIPGIENLDVSEFVQGHMAYRAKMPRLLRECGWLVESDEFTEIEDPDPENHQARQRELINEIEEARKELEKEGKAPKGGFFSFGRKKKALKKQEWEIYEDSAKQGGGGGSGSGKTEDTEGNNHGVLFDVEAIRLELAKEAAYGDRQDPEQFLQVRELQSTLPPMKLDISPSSSPGLVPPTAAGTLPTIIAPTTPTAKTVKSPRDSLRETQSAEAIGTYGPVRSSYEYRVSEERTATYPLSSAGGSHTSGNSIHSPSHGRNSHNFSQSAGYLGHHDDGDDYEYHHRPASAAAHEDGNDEIQMTFDTSFDGHAGASDSSAHRPPPPVPRKDYDAFGRPDKVSEAMGTDASRPGMRTSQTVPNITLADPWADDDDDEEEFGKEKEISMTFA